MLRSVLQGNYPNHFLEKNLHPSLLVSHTPWSQEIYFGGFPIQIGFSLLATQLVTPKSTKTTK